MNSPEKQNSPAPLTVYIIRHGQTAGNHAGRLQGRSDLPLNSRGEAQAERAGRWFRERGIAFDRVFSSPLRRARQTALLAAGDVPQEIDLRLIEMDYGPYEGADLRSPAPEILAWFRDFTNNPAPEGIESLASVTARMGSFLRDLAARGTSGVVLISTHAIAMKGALEYLTPESRGGYWSRTIGNCAVYRTEYTSGGFTVPVAVLEENQKEMF